MEDDSAASRETLKSFEADDVRALAPDFVRVRVPAGGKEAGWLRARWAPTVLLVRTDSALSEKDQACIKTLREHRVTVDFEGTPLVDGAAVLSELGRLAIRMNPLETEESTYVTLKRTDGTLGEVLREYAEAAGKDFAVIEGAVFIGTKDGIRQLKLRRELVQWGAKQMEGLPEHTKEDLRVAELLRRPIDLDLRRVDMIVDAAARWNAALGEPVIQPTEAMADAFIRSERFENWTSLSVLDGIDAFPKLVWYQKGGKVILSDKPELVALTPSRLRGFIVESVECDESLLPEGAVGEIEGLVRRLGGDDPGDRDTASGELNQWVGKSATSKTVLRRLLRKTADTEVKARLEALVGPKRSP